MKMTEIEVQQLASEALRRRLSDLERAALRSHFATAPQAAEEWRESMLLNEALRRLPELQPASNFTSRVLEEVRRVEPRQPRISMRRWWAGWKVSQGIACAVLLLGVGTLFYHQHRVAERVEVAQALAAISDATMLFNSASQSAGLAAAKLEMPTVQVLQDFDAIRSLRTVPVELDLDLLKALE